MIETVSSLFASAMISPVDSSIKGLAKTLPSKTGADLNPHQADEIDNLVREKLSPEALKGKFVYSNDFLVVYQYIVEKDVLQYTVYDKVDAKANGLYSCFYYTVRSFRCTSLSLLENINFDTDMIALLQ